MKKEKSWREERKNSCEFYRSGNKCYLRDMETCEYDGMKLECGFYLSEMYNPDTLPILKTEPPHITELTWFNPLGRKLE